MTQTDRQQQGPAGFRAGWKVFWVGFLVRILYITVAHTYRFSPVGNHFAFGFEMGRVARALALGHGYADPFDGRTGPTTWVPPLYPLLLAGVFRLFGIYTLLSGWIILVINSLFSALTALTTYEIAARCYGRRVAFWSAWIWALYPAALQYAVRWVWEMSLSTYLLTWVVVLALRMRGVGEEPADLHGAEPRSFSRWLLFGGVWGLVALSNPSLLLFLPAAGLWVLRGARDLRKQTGYAVASAAVFLLCIAPWVVRNALVFHRFIPMRANFGAELYMGNGPGATGFLMEYDHPYQARDQLRLYREMGEVAYAQMRGRAAERIIAADPGLFVRNTIKRFYFFWVSVPHPSGKTWIIEAGRVLNYSFASLAGLLGLGLALRRRKPGAWLFFWAFVLLPLIYYFVTVHARFRNPLEPMIAILAVYLFRSTDRSRWFSWQAVRG